MAPDTSMMGISSLLTPDIEISPDRWHAFRNAMWGVAGLDGA
jgi:hypothetical protein